MRDIKPQISPMERKAIQFLRDHECAANTRALAEHLNESAMRTRNRLNKMVEKRFLHKATICGTCYYASYHRHYEPYYDLDDMALANTFLNLEIKPSLWKRVWKRIRTLFY